MTEDKNKSAAVKATDIPWMRTAHGYIGVHEGVGKLDNPTVVEFFKLCDHSEIRHDETPWCAAFVGAVLVKNGIAIPPAARNLWALTYAEYGQKLPGPLVGAIGAKKRNGGGHVFFVAGFDKHFVYALGGNQNDQVCISRIPRSQIVAYRWPPGVPIPAKTAAGTTKADASNAREA